MVDIDLKILSQFENSFISLTLFGQCQVPVILVLFHEMYIIRWQAPVDFRRRKTVAKTMLSEYPFKIRVCVLAVDVALSLSTPISLFPLLSLSLCLRSSWPHSTEQLHINKNNRVCVCFTTKVTSMHRTVAHERKHICVCVWCVCFMVKVNSIHRTFALEGNNFVLHVNLERYRA